MLQRWQVVTITVVAAWTSRSDAPQTRYRVEVEKGVPERVPLSREWVARGDTTRG
ncbi:MAG: hypothetical protein BMS9Abin20_0808 [Acidimicrobiia bacterium]|nr:MAG: hypothetical protein BMS9Abin20_0808 [Acidimicrobiia bacterium]